MDPESLAAHAKGVKALARSLLRDDAAADDVVQDACAAALAQQPDTPTRPWLVRVVRNLSLKRLRTEARRRRRERQAAQREAMPPAAEVVERAETHRLLVKAVLALEEPYRSTLLLHYFDGHDVAEIGKRLGRPAATVRTHLHRGVIRLRKRFGAKGLALLLPLIGLPRPASAAPLGVVAMSTGKKSLVVAALLLLAIATAVVVTAPFGSDPEESRRTGTARTAVPPEAEGERETDPKPVRAVDRELDLHGVVVDESNAPIAGAKIATSWDPWKRAYMGDPGKPRREVHGPQTVSGADGRFSLRLRRGQRVDLSVTADGFATAELGFLQAGERVRVVMSRGVTLTVEVVDAAGKPAPATALWLRRDEREGIDRIERAGTTGADGRCRFAGLPPAQWASLEGRHPALGAIPWQVSLSFPLTGERVERIRIPPGRVLRGTVVDDETGAPVKGARVSDSWVIRHFVETDDLGRFSFAGWGSNKEFEVNASAPGYLRARKQLALENDIELRLKRGWSVTGRVLDPAGKPLAAAALAIWGRGGDARLSFQEGVSAADGRFTLGPLAPDTVHTLFVAPPERGKILFDLGPPKEGATFDAGDLVVPAGQVLGGRVLRPDGSPAAGVLVQLSGGNNDRGRFGFEPPGSVGAGTNERRRTDDLGRFRFNDLAPGSYAVQAIPLGMKPLDRAARLPEGRDVTDLELKLVGGHDLLVRVRDQYGEPVPNVYVNVQTAADKWSFSRRADAAGNARFTSDKPFTSVGRIWAVTQPLLPSPTQQLAPGTTEATVEVRRARWATGTVFDTQGRPFPQVNLAVFHGGRPADLGDPFSSNQSWTDVSGHFRIPVPIGGTAAIELTGGFNAGFSEGRKYPPFAGRLEGIRPGARDLELRARPLEFDRRLTVRVLDPDGRPLAGAQVYASLRGKLVPGTNKLTNADGYVQLERLPEREAGIFAKALDAPEDWLKISRFVLAEGQEIEMKIRIGVRVSGVVTENGKTVPQAWIALTRESGLPVKQGRTDERGRFSLLVDPKEAGPFTLWATRWEGRKQFRAKLEGYTPGTEPLKLALAPVPTK